MRSRFTRRRWIGTAAALLVALPLSAQAAPVQISTNGYGGEYALYVAGGPRLADYSNGGDAAPDLVDGSYVIKVGRYDPALIFFTVSGGQITVQSSNQASATASGSTLTFNTTPVTIEPASYTGDYIPYWRPLLDAVAGSAVYTLVKGLQYQVGIGGRGQGNEIVFSVDGSGNVSSVSPTTSGTPAGSTLYLNSREILIEPVNFTGTYQFYWEYPYPGPTHTGQTTQYVVVDVPFFIGVGRLGYPDTDARFTIPASGELVQTATTQQGQTLRISVPVPSPDSTPPTTTVTITPDPSTTASTGGWYNSSVGTVSVSLSAADDNGGSGVKSLEYSTDGGGSWNPYSSPLTYTADGIDTIQYRATDNAGNVEKNLDGSYKSVTIKIDKTPPTVTLGAADGLWHADDVSITNSASDAGSGLANSSDASFTLSTTVPAGTETSSAQTNSRVITDVAGNSTTAGPITGIMVDKKAPAITLTTPANGASYLLNQPVTASYTLADGGSGVDTSHSSGTAANGSPIDTGSAGSKSFTVNAQDNVGNTAMQSVSYSVGYKIVPLYDPTKYAKSGSTIPIKLQLTDYSNANVSSAGINVTAQGVTLTGSATSTVPADAGSANPDNNFRYDAGLGGYIYNLSTKGLSGTYTLSFTVGSDPTVYTAQFQVR